MKKRPRGDLCLILCGLLVYFTADAQHLRQQAASALSLCTGTVIPALFPFMVVTGLLVSSGAPQLLSPYLAGVMGPLFHLPGHAGAALVLGLTAGYPVGARTAGDLYAAGALTRQEAQRLLTFCNNANPVFLVTVLGVGVFGSVRVGLWLWMLHVLSALIAGVLFRSHGAHRPGGPPPAHRPPLPLSQAVVSSIQEAVRGVANICGVVVFFSILSAPLGALPWPWGTLAVGVIELFSLIPHLAPTLPGLVIAAGCAGWGGLCVMCQTAACLDGTDLSVTSCLLGKAVQGLLSALLAFLLAPAIL